jgi:hypothetical protein
MSKFIGLGQKTTGPSGILRQDSMVSIIENNTENSANAGINSSINTTYPNDDIRKFGLRDKIDQAVGLVQSDPASVQVTTVEHTVIGDTRDCIGEQSLIDAQTIAESNGYRPAASGYIVSVSAVGVQPVLITLNSVAELKNNDYIFINGVQGATSINGQVSVTNINYTLNTANIPGIVNATYTGGGTWIRPTDQGYPSITTNNYSIIDDNMMIINLNKPLRDIRSMTLYHIVIPRDIIPLYVYVKDFIPVATTFVNTDYGITETNFETFIPQEEQYMNNRIIGFYSSPLDLWRSYSAGAMSMSDQITPGPLTLWNPPGPGAWPLQPIPYPFQTVPTYRSDDFTISGESGVFHIVLAGFGVYDLFDWTANTGNPATDSLTTSLMRKLLLFLICPKQSYRNRDYIDLIISCEVVDTGSLVFPFGYGSFQRFIPGPGVQQNYQPATLLAGDPTVPSVDSPIPFPYFRGNVWGPYNSPGDRFQKLGLRSIIQDLYLNGDLSNLHGDPIILPNVPTSSIPSDPSYGLNFNSLIEVSMSNVEFSSNPNILNAMRIVSNGFGAATTRANGSGTTYTDIYKNAGGIGPSSLGTPSAWTFNGVNYPSGSGTGNFTDQIAQGPYGPNMTSESADASTTGTAGLPLYRSAYYDLGPNSGAFKTQVRNYIEYFVNDVPDTDIIIKVQEAEKSNRFQSTNSFNDDAILDCPVRLNVGSSNGTLQYVESLESLIAGSSSYWEKRFMVPVSRLERLHLTFFTYNGIPIPLEKMLILRRSLSFLRLAVRIINGLDLDPSFDPFKFTYLFDPLNPQLLSRVKRYFQIIFKINCYETVAPGMNVTSYQGTAPSIPTDSTISPYY